MFKETQSHLFHITLASVAARRLCGSLASVKFMVAALMYTSYGTYIASRLLVTTTHFTAAAAVMPATSSGKV